MGRRNPQTSWPTNQRTRTNTTATINSSHLNESPPQADANLVEAVAKKYSSVVVFIYWAEQLWWATYRFLRVCLFVRILLSGSLPVQLSVIVEILQQKGGGLDFPWPNHFPKHATGRLLNSIGREDEGGRIVYLEERSHWWRRSCWWVLPTVNRL